MDLVPFIDSIFLSEKMMRICTTTSISCPALPFDKKPLGLNKTTIPEFSDGCDAEAATNLFTLEHLTLEMLAYGRQKPAFSHFVARIFKKILAEQLTHFIRYLL